MAREERIGEAARVIARAGRYRCGGDDGEPTKELSTCKIR